MSETVTTFGACAMTLSATRDAAAGHADGCTLSMMISAAQASGPGEDCFAIRLPALKPAIGEAAIDVADNLGQQWRISSSEIDGAAMIELERTGAGDPDGRPWKLYVDLASRLPAALQVIRGASVTPLGGEQTAIGDIPVAPRPAGGNPVEVRLTTDPADTIDLAFGTVVHLRCTLKGVDEKTSRLIGPLAQDREHDVRDGDTRTVWALSSATYRLTAEADVSIGGEQMRQIIVRSVTVSVARPQVGATFNLLPGGTILPGGQIACYWQAVNLRELAFRVDGDDRPDLRSHAPTFEGAGAVLNQSFSIWAGPETRKKWTITAEFRSDDPKSPRGEIVRQITAAQAEKIDITDPQPHRPQDIAAGVGTVEIMTGAKVLEPRPAEWVATATAVGLEIYATWFLNGAPKHWRRNIFSDRNGCLGVAALNATGDAESVVAVIRENAGLVLYRIDDVVNFVYRDPGREPRKMGAVRADIVPQSIGLLPEEGFGHAERICLLTLGLRVYVIGPAGAVSIDLAAKGGFVHEPWLSLMPWPSWDVAALPTAQPGGGCLYALDKREGTLLRLDGVLDPTPGQGTLKSPCVAAPVNRRLARLDRLQRAQGGKNDDLTPDGRFDLQRPREPGRHAIWNVDPACVDGSSRLLAIAGALVVRCMVPDEARAHILQDRAYDPALDVWVRCGHPFPEADQDRDAVFAATRRRARGKTGKATSAQLTIYCRKADGTLWRLEGDILEMIGFVGVNMTPHPALARPGEDAVLPAGLAWRGDSLRAAESLSPGQYLQSRNGRFRLVNQEDGNVVLYRLSAERVWKSTDPLDKNSMGQWKHAASSRLWAIEASGRRGPCDLVMEPDGLLTLRDRNAAGRAWSSAAPDAGDTTAALRLAAARQGVTLARVAAAEHAGCRLVLDDDGRLAVLSFSGVRLWQAPRVLTALAAGDWLMPGDQLVCAGKPGLALKYGDDGGFAWGGWSAGLQGPAGGVALRRDGVLEAFSRADAAPRWASAARGGPSGFLQAAATRQQVTLGKDGAAELAGCRLVLDEAGRLAVLSFSGVRLWQAPRVLTALAAGDWLMPEDRIVAKDKKSSPTLDYSLDGSLHCGKWSTGALGPAGGALLRENGQLDVFGRDDAEPCWSTLWRGGRVSAAAGRAVLQIEGERCQIAHDAIGTAWASDQYQGNSAVHLRGGDFIEDAGKRRALVMHPRGNLVLYGPRGQVDWSSHADALAPSGGVNGHATVDNQGNLFVKPSSNEWQANGNGATTGLQYCDEAGEMFLDTDGFVIRARGDGTPWYGARKAGTGFPKTGQVAQYNARSVRVVSQGGNGYLFAHAGDRRDGDRRMVLYAHDGGAGFHDNVWIVTQLSKKKFTIFNNYHKEFMVVDENYWAGNFSFWNRLDNTDQNRRMIYCSGENHAFKNGRRDGYFNIIPGPDAGSDIRIKSVKYPEEHVYGSVMAYAEPYRFVFTWVPRDDLTNEKWRFEPAP